MPLPLPWTPTCSSLTRRGAGCWSTATRACRPARSPRRRGCRSASSTTTSAPSRASSWRCSRRRTGVAWTARGACTPRTCRCGSATSAPATSSRKTWTPATCGSSRRCWPPAGRMRRSARRSASCWAAGLPCWPRWPGRPSAATGRWARSPPRRRPPCGHASRLMTATWSATGSRSTTRCSASASRRCCCCRPGRSSTRGTGRCRSPTSRGIAACSPLTGAATAAPTGRRRPRRTPSASSRPTRSR